jgi:glutamyl-tRNA synthetase
LIKERLHILSEFTLEAAYFFEEPKAFDEKVIAKRFNARAATSLKAIAESWGKLGDWSAASIQTAFESALTVTGQKPGEVVQLLRVSLSGVAGGPIIWEMCELLGQERCVNRLDSFLSKHEPAS